MNKDQFESHWNQIKGKIKEKWEKLSDKDITHINGKFDRLVTVLKKAYGLKTKQIEEQIHNWKLEHSEPQKGQSGHQQPQGYGRGHHNDKQVGQPPSHRDEEQRLEHRKKAVLH